MITLLFSVALRRSGVLNLPPGIDANSAEVGRLLLSMSIMLKLALVLVFLYISSRWAISRVWAKPSCRFP